MRRGLRLSSGRGRPEGVSHLLALDVFCLKALATSLRRARSNFDDKEGVYSMHWNHRQSKASVVQLYCCTRPRRRNACNKLTRHAG